MWQTAAPTDNKWTKVTATIGERDHGHDLAFEAYHGNSAGSSPSLLYLRPLIDFLWTAKEDTNSRTKIQANQSC